MSSIILSTWKSQTKSDDYALEAEDVRFGSTSIVFIAIKFPPEAVSEGEGVKEVSYPLERDELRRLLNWLGKRTTIDASKSLPQPILEDSGRAPVALREDSGRAPVALREDSGRAPVVLPEWSSSSLPSPILNSVGVNSGERPSE